MGPARYIETYQGHDIYYADGFEYHFGGRRGFDTLNQCRAAVERHNACAEVTRLGQEMQPVQPSNK